MVGRSASNVHARMANAKTVWLTMRNGMKNLLKLFPCRQQVVDHGRPRTGLLYSFALLYKRMSPRVARRRCIDTGRCCRCRCPCRRCQRSRSHVSSLQLRRKQLERRRRRHHCRFNATLCKVREHSTDRRRGETRTTHMPDQFVYALLLADKENYSCR